MNRRGVTLMASGLLLVACQTASEPLASTTPSTPPATIGAPQVLELTVEEFAFNTDTLHAVAGRPIVVHLVNNDNAIKHNFELWRDDSRQDKLFHGDLLEGIGEFDYEVGSLEPGEYYFECFPHPDLMNGRLVVEGG